MKKFIKQFTADKGNIKIVLLVAFLFLVSANLAWINPNRGGHVIKTHPKIPLFWQYGGDSSQEFLSAAFFPGYYATDKTRVARPGYPLLAKGLGLALTLPLRPFMALDPLLIGLAGYLALKFLVFTVVMLLLYDILKRWLDPAAAWLGVLLAMFNPYAIYYLTQFHTAELQFIGPVFIAWLFMDLVDRYTTKKNIGYSFLVGFLMLAKPNYAAYLAFVILSAFIFKRYRAAALSFLVQFLPFALWLLFLKYAGLKYYNNEVEGHGQLVWIFKDLLFRPFFEIIKVTGSIMENWLVLFVRHYSIFIFLALAALVKFWDKIKYRKEFLAFLAIFLFLNFGQYMSVVRNQPYLVADLSLVVYPLAAWLIWELLKSYRQEKMAVPLAALYLLLSLLSLAVFPWVHPYNQVNVLDAKQDRVDVYKSGQLIDKNY